jgi:hypothetical protein
LFEKGASTASWNVFSLYLLSHCFVVNAFKRPFYVAWSSLIFFLLLHSSVCLLDVLVIGFFWRGIFWRFRFKIKETSFYLSYEFLRSILYPGFIFIVHCTFSIGTIKTCCSMIWMIEQFTKDFFKMYRSALKQFWKSRAERKEKKRGMLLTACDDNAWVLDFLVMLVALLGLH